MSCFSLPHKMLFSWNHGGLKHWQCNSIISEYTSKCHRFYSHDLRSTLNKLLSFLMIQFFFKTLTHLRYKHACYVTTSSSSIWWLWFVSPGTSALMFYHCVLARFTVMRLSPCVISYGLAENSCPSYRTEEKLTLSSTL